MSIKALTLMIYSAVLIICLLPIFVGSMQLFNNNLQGLPPLIVGLFAFFSIGGVMWHYKAWQDDKEGRCNAH